MLRAQLPYILLGACLIFLSSTILRLRGEESQSRGSFRRRADINQSCGFAGNSDIYGLGIRLGVYFQWVASMLSKRYLTASSPELLRELLDANTIFSLSIFIATALLTTGSLGTVHGAEILIMLHIYFGEYLYRFLRTASERNSRNRNHLLGRRSDCSPSHRACLHTPYGSGLADWMELLPQTVEVTLSFSPRWLLKAQLGHSSNSWQSSIWLFGAQASCYLVVLVYRPFILLLLRTSLFPIKAGWRRLVGWIRREGVGMSLEWLSGRCESHIRYYFALIFGYPWTGKRPKRRSGLFQET